MGRCVLRRLAATLVLLGCEARAASAAPKLQSLYPLAAQRGTTVDIDARGADVQRTYAVWLGAGTKLVSKDKQPLRTAADGVEAQVEATSDSSRVALRLVIAADARLGLHTIGLVSPTGLSGNLSFWVWPHAAVRETDMSHETAAKAQTLKLPAAVSGRIAASGEVDFYAFDVPSEQTVAFELTAFHGPNFDPQLALYEVGGSFLDAQRCKRLVFREEVTQGGMPANRRLTYRFARPGRYAVSVSNIFAQGSGECSYLLRIAPEKDVVGGANALTWARQRLEEIGSRAVAAPAVNVVAVQPLGSGRAAAFTIPAVLQGVIARQGQVDLYRFTARADEKLVFETHAPRAAPPFFNIRLDVLDPTGAVVLSNLQVKEGKIVDTTSRMIQVASSVMGKLERKGEYTVRIRDLTSLQASPEHVYHVFVRPQIPHLGPSRVQPDGPINMVAGGRQRLTLAVPPAEGCTGSLAVSIEGLPRGVRAFVGMNSIVDLVADTGAPATLIPCVLRLWGLPEVGGKSGRPFPIAELPLMVLKK